MKISIIGCGYVGLVSGLCLAEKEHKVFGIDKDIEKINSLKKNDPLIYEKGLKKLLKKHNYKNFIVSNDINKSIQETDVTMIAVGTPFFKNKIDLSLIKNVAKEIGIAMKYKNSYHSVIVKSTVVPGTTDGLVRKTLEKYSSKKAGIDFGLGMNPEFLREGSAVLDFMNPDRLVFGGSNARIHKVQKEMYSKFKGVSLIKTNNKTAEMIKYSSNSFFATLISFSNEIGNLCEKLEEVSSNEVLNAVKLDGRISPILRNGKRISPQLETYLKSGCGFGGSCFPKDLKALVSFGEDQKESMELMKSVLEVNSNQPTKVINKLKKHYKTFKGKNITILGLSFKPESDDIRESPSIEIIKKLLKLGAKIKAHDPMANKNTMKLFKKNDLKFFNNLKDAIDGSEIILVLTAWKQFKSLNKIIDKNKTTPLIVDGRNFLDVKKYKNIEVLGA